MILVKHIDAIAREKQRAVLYLEFHPEERKLRSAYRFDQDVARDQLLTWLDSNEIVWQACGPVASVTRIEPYRGQVYLDVPFDESSPEYRKLKDTLENPDGTMKHSWVRFMVLPLEHALQNTEHDKPGFWDRWAEEF